MPVFTSNIELSDEYPSIRPTLDLNFAATKTLDRRITFTRGSLGTYTDHMGVLKYASNNVPRFDHDPTTGESLGLLIEESRTNIITYSQDFTQPIWQSVNNRATCDNTTGIDDPSGGTTASRWSSGTSNGQELIFRQTGTSTGTLTGQTCTKSTWIRRVSNDGSVSLFIGDNVGNVINSQLDSVPVGTWVRCSITRTIVGDSGDTRNYIAVYPGTDGQPTTIDIWGDQFEIGSFATSYIPTSGSTVTRAADIAKITGTNFTDFFNQTEGTIKCSYWLGNDTTGLRVFQINDSDNSVIDIIAGSGGGNGGYGYVSTGGVAQANAGQSSANASYLNTLHVTTLAYKENDVAGINIKTGVLTTDTSAALDGAYNRVTFYQGTGETDFLNGHIQQVSYYPKRLPNAQLQGLTQQ